MNMKTVERVYDFIVEFMEEHQYSPSTREICNGTGLKSTSSVNEHLKSLKKNGLIDYVELNPRTISLTGYKLKKIEQEQETDIDTYTETETVD